MPEGGVRATGAVGGCREAPAGARIADGGHRVGRFCGRLQITQRMNEVPGTGVVTMR